MQLSSNAPARLVELLTALIPCIQDSSCAEDDEGTWISGTLETRSWKM